jgi:hypothetical protein
MSEINLTKVQSPVFQLPDHARVWAYQSKEPLSEKEQKKLKAALDEFLESWQAHGSSMTAAGDFLLDHFLIIAADEEKVKATGCSIDSSVYFVKELEKKFEVDFFDRMQVAYLKNGSSISICSLSELEGLSKKKEVSENTKVFNNLVANVGELKERWLLPIKESWHNQFIDN